jgi:16S rRNA (uracil1498-N3)-methyltransferase
MAGGLHRFFVDPASLGGEQVALTGDQAHQISRVLRLKPGQKVVLVDGIGHDVTVRLDEVRSTSVAGTVEARQASRPEPSLILTLFQALVPRERFETVLQKGTEVGVARFVPTWCERSIVPGGDQIDEKRLERWRRIVTEAAEQCERGRVPEIALPLRFAEALRGVRAEGRPALLAWEREDSESIRRGLDWALSGQPSGRAHLGLFIGPEGGFTEAEVEAARYQNVHTVSLGPRILRTETAGPILAALALYHAGDLAPSDPNHSKAPPPRPAKEGGSGDGAEP